MNSALFKPLYAANPGELVSIFWGDTEGHGLSNHSYADYLDYRKESAAVLSGLAAFTTVPANLVLGQGTERVNVGLASDNYFSVLGVSPIVGRAFLPEENNATGASFVAVISESLWRQEFGGTSDLGGKSVWLNNASYSVIGVVPDRASRMAVVAKIDVFVPVMMEGVIGGDPDFLSKRGNKELRNIPAHMSSTSDTATWVTISPLRSRERRRPVVWLRSPSFRPSTPSGLVACNAGASPIGALRRRQQEARQIGACNEQEQLRQVELSQFGFQLKQPRFVVCRSRHGWLLP